MPHRQKPRSTMTLRRCLTWMVIEVVVAIAVAIIVVLLK
jgi:hypothetical protein